MFQFPSNSLARLVSVSSAKSESEGEAATAAFSNEVEDGGSVSSAIDLLDSEEAVSPTSAGGAGWFEAGPLDDKDLEEFR
jgi:hypothetical protein